MNVAQLISFLQVLPMDSKIQIRYFVDSYEPPQIDDVHTVTFKEAEILNSYPEMNRPNRVILS